MDLKADFRKAIDEVKKLTYRPTNEELLQLYGLFKQATEGDASGKRPGILDLKGRAKFDAWSAKKGSSVEAAMRDYISLAHKLLSHQG